MKSLQTKIEEGRQYRTAQQITGSDDETMIVEGYASTFEEEYPMGGFEMGGTAYCFYEQVDRHAFDECDMSDVIMQYDHEGRVLARTRNNTLEISTDEHGLKIRADLSKSALGRGLYEDIKNGIVDRMSFGFTIEDDKQEESSIDDNTRKILRTITKVGKLYDVSAVSFPANEGTEISARSYQEGVIESKRQELQKREENEAKRKALILKLKIAQLEDQK